MKIRKIAEGTEGFVSLKERGVRKLAGPGKALRRQREPGELIVTKKGMIGPAWAVLLGMLIRHGMRALMALVAFKLFSIAVVAATAAPGGHSTAVVIKGLFQAAATLMK